MRIVILSHHPVFDHKNGGGRLGKFSHVNDININLGRWEVDGEVLVDFTLVFFLFEQGAVCFLCFERFVLALGCYLRSKKKKKKKAPDRNCSKRPQAHSFNRDP